MTLHLSFAWSNFLRVSLGMLASIVMMKAIAQDNQPIIEVWKDPACGCCFQWVEHLKDEGFSVNVHHEASGVKRQELGLPAQFGSCHTAVVDGYLVEGHVPARDLRRLLLERPQALGLAVPGMPIGSPGMDDAIYGGRKDPYDVLLVHQNGTAEVFSAY